MIITQLMEGLDEIRPAVLSSKEPNADLRSTLRHMFDLLEQLQHMPFIEPHLYQRVILMLSQMFDAEHGALLKHLHNTQAQNNDWEILQTHLKERQHLLEAAVSDMPLLTGILQRSSVLLGQSLSEQTDIRQKCLVFERIFRLHLDQDASFQDELRLLVIAFKESIKTMAHVLEDVGESSPELAQIQAILEQDLPKDPKQAQTILHEARNHILHAGKKLSSAGQQIKASMSSQVEKMSALSARLEEAESQARNDPLTGLANRRKLSEYFQAIRPGTTPVLLMLDIDHFKHINDTYGHDIGDQVLEQLSRILLSSVRESDIVARLGGEEFCIVLPKVNLTQGKTLAESIRIAVEATGFNTTQGKVVVRISMGVAMQQANESLTAWIKRADEALYHAKENGRNQVVIAENKAK